MPRCHQSVGTHGGGGQFRLTLKLSCARARSLGTCLTLAHSQTCEIRAMQCIHTCTYWSVFALARLCWRPLAYHVMVDLVYR